MMEGIFTVSNLLFILGAAVADLALGILVGKFLRGVGDRYPEER